jgi:Peptidase M50B-like
MVTRSLEGALRGIGEVQAHLPGTTAVLVGVAALGAATLPGISLVTQHVNTMAHEGAHAAVGSVMGRRVTGVKLSGDGTGLTGLAGPRGAGLVLAGLVGYLGPSAVGVGAAKLIEVGHSVAVLWLTLLALVLLMVPLRRSAFGLTAVIATGIGIYLVARYAPVGGQVALAYGIAWFLLLSGIRVVLRHGRDAHDAVVLRQLTRLPPGVWASAWLAGSAAALVFGGSLLV